uniref:Uncharacterized protein n=1 Tax=Arundo donax TaxID=35708 RepID=A0A0A8XNV5_ARUDO
MPMINGVGFYLAISSCAFVRRRRSNGQGLMSKLTSCA